MARRSQERIAMSVLPLASLLLTGCIIPEAPEYGDPRMGRVYIDQSSIEPSPRSVVFSDLLASSDTLRFKVNVHSEDAGQRLYAVLYVDYKHTNSKIFRDRSYPPLTSDEERTISFDFPLENLALPSCHVMTLMVVHEVNYDLDARLPIGAPFDLASVDWVVVRQSETARASLDSCPSNSSQVQ